MKWSDAKHRLIKKSPAELVALLKRLYDLNPENKSFFEANLVATGDASLDYYKKEISKGVNPSINMPLDLKRGRKAITAYKRAAPDDLWGRVELMMHYVEQGAKFTLTYGDIDGPFYDSLMNMLDDIVEVSDRLSSAEYAHLVNRFELLDAQTRDQIGWGFSDHISGVTEELQAKPRR